MLARVISTADRLAFRLMTMLAAVTIAAASTFPAVAQQYQVDDSSSKTLTDYLHHHRLPLVGAQVFTTADGERKLLLYGYVATEFGKGDAERKALKFLGDSTIATTNSIKVNPAIVNGGARQSGSDASGPVRDTDQQWNKVMMGIYRNGLQPLPQPGVAPQP
jgi:hypothetical protein